MQWLYFLFNLLTIVFRQILEDAVKNVCNNTYAIGYVDCCDIEYFDDNCFDFEDVIHVSSEIPCLFLAYNKEKIHVYFRIPKV